MLLGVQSNLLVIKYKSAFKNNEEKPESFFMHLTSGAGVGKGFFINVITEYVKRNLKYHGQKLEQPSNAVIASTGKAASHINGLILHLAFHLQINVDNNSNAKYGLPFKEVLQRQGE